MFNGLIRRNNNNKSLGTMIDKLFAPADEFDKVFDVFNDEFFQPHHWAKSNYPMNIVSVKEKGQTVAKRIEYALAGFRKDEITLSIKDDILTIEAEHKQESDENEIPEYNGISYKKMSLSYALMENADQEKITCKFENGLLSITIPLKKEEEQPNDSKRIEIQ